MGAPIRLLGSDGLAAAVAAVDAVDVVRRGLVSATDRSTCTLRPWPAGEDHTTAELVLVDDGVSGFLFPAAGLRAVHAAALATLAAAELLRPGAVRAAVLGAGSRSLLTMIARRLRTVRHLTLHPAHTPIDRAALDEIDLSGLTASATDDPDHALRGAGLVFATAWPPHVAAVAPGATVVNVGGHDLPRDLVAAADQTFVSGAEHPTAVDLADVITGTHPGRTDPDAVVLVDLPDAGALDVALASSLHRAVRDRGLWAPRLD